MTKIAHKSGKVIIGMRVPKDHALVKKRIKLFLNLSSDALSIHYIFQKDFQNNKY